jgi:hypothetical protein
LDATQYEIEIVAPPQQVEMTAETVLGPEIVGVDEGDISAPRAFDPAFSCGRIRSAGDQALAMASDWSVEPSSTTITSIGRWSWAKTLVSASARKGAAL